MGGDKRTLTLLALLPAAIGLLFLWELVFLEGVPVARDMQMFFVPQKRLLADALSQGRLPLWTSLIGTGAPFLANFQSGVFYPPHWIFLIVPFFPAFNLLVLLHFAIGGAFSYRLGREAELSAPGAVALAVTFMLGGYFASLLNLINALQAAAWVPGFGYFLLRHSRRPSGGSFSGLVVTGALGFLAGEPQTFLLGAVACTAYAALRWLTTDRSAPLVRVLPGLAIAAAVVLGLCMIQILPTAELVAGSSRGGGLAYEEAGAFALQPSRLVHLLLPADYSDPVYRFGIKSQIGTGDPWLFSNYLGAVALVLAVAAWAESERRREVVLWSALAAAGVLASMGDHTAVFRLMYDYVPGVSAFRFPEKFFLLSGLGTAFLAGAGVDALSRGRRPPRAWMAAAALLAVAGLAKLGWIAFGDAFVETAADRFAGQNFALHAEFAWDVWGRRIDVLLVLAILLLVLLRVHRRDGAPRDAIVWMIVVLLGIDFWIAHRNLNPVVEPRFYERTPLIAEQVPLDEVQRRFRYRAAPLDDPRPGLDVRADVALETQKWLWQQMLQPNVGQLYRVQSPDNWDAIHLERYADRRSISVLLEPAARARLFALHSVKWGYSASPPSSDALYRRVVALDSLPGFAYEVRDPLPRAYVVGEGLVFDEETDALNAALAPDFDPHGQVALLSTEAGSGRTAVVEPTGETAPGPAGSARILEGVGERVRIEVEAQRPGWLVLTDSFYPGWRVLVDGTPRPLHRANYFFRAVRVRPGDREVVFSYRSEAFERGRRISVATLGLLFAGLVGIALRDRVSRSLGDRAAT